MFEGGAWRICQSMLMAGISRRLWGLEADGRRAIHRCPHMGIGESRENQTKLSLTDSPLLEGLRELVEDPIAEHVGHV